jgi:hypothetical protein
MALVSLFISFLFSRRPHSWRIRLLYSTAMAPRQVSTYQRRRYRSWNGSSRQCATEKPARDSKLCFFSTGVVVLIRT